MNIRRIIWRLVLVFVVLFVAVPLLAVTYAILWYSDSSSDVRRVVESAQASEPAVPRLAVNVFMRLNTFSQRNWYTYWALHAGIRPETESGPVMRNTERMIRQGVSMIVTPLRLCDDEQAALYWSRIYLGEGTYGLSAGAEKHFGKKPQDLSEEEMIRLWVIAISPNRYKGNPALFENRLAWAMRVWRGEADASSPMITTQKSRNFGG